jgi:PAS domain-containing protein
MMAAMDDVFEHNALYGLQHATLGVVVLDGAFRVTAISPTVERMVRLTAEALVGKSVTELHPHGGAERVIAMLQSVREGKTGSAASLIIPVPGRLLLLKIAALLGQDMALDGGFVLSLLDVMEVSRRADGSAVQMPPQSRPVGAQTAPPKHHPHLVKLPVETPNGISLLDLDDVVCLTASGRYAEVKTRQGRPRMSGLSLKDLEDRLDPARFLRVHRAHMVNMDFAQSFQRRGESCALVMADDAATVVPIGRSRVSLVRGLLGL